MQTLVEGTLCHGPAYIPAEPAALGDESQAAFLRDGHAVGNVVALGVEVASAEVNRACALEAFLGVARVGVHSVRTDPAAVDSLRGHSDCT